MKIEIAQTPLKRMRGLLGRKSLAQGEGLVIRPCNAVHTLGMQFPLDLRFYSKVGTLIKVVHDVPPGRIWIWGGWRAHCVLESAAGDTSFENFDIMKCL